MDEPVIKLTRKLDPIEIRILGSLLEKQQSTPEYYPLTLNALIAACNQKTNRDPVMDLPEGDVAIALDRLQHEGLVWKVMGGRAPRWEHNLDKKWGLDGPSRAIMTLLLLRGSQTIGELRARSDRLHPFGSMEEVDQQLRKLAAEEEPLVVGLPRRAGQKESRWMHLVGNDAMVLGPSEPYATTYAIEPIAFRLERLEAEVGALREEIRQLRERLGE